MDAKQVCAKVDEWVKKHLQNSPVSHNTHSYNQVMTCLPQLCIDLAKPDADAEHVINSWYIQYGPQIVAGAQPEVGEHLFSILPKLVQKFSAPARGASKEA